MDKKDNNISKSFGQSLLDLYVYGSFHIALSASLYTLFFFQYLEYSNWWYIFFVFFSTWTVYGAHKAIGIVKVEAFSDKGRFNVIRLYRKHIYAYIVIGVIGALISWLYLRWNIKLFVLALGILPTLYVIPIFSRKRRLRDFGIVKIFLVAITWSIIATTIPLIEYDLTTNIAYTLSSALFIFGITIPFDIRDLDIEEALDVKTIPSIIGVKKSKILAISCLLIAGFISIAIIGHTLFEIAFTLSSIICAILVYLFGKKNNDFYYSLLLDGTMMLPIFLYWILVFIAH